MRPIIPVSILFAVAIAASASPYPQALPDWNASRDIGVFYPPTMTQEQPSTKLALVAEPEGIGSEIPVLYSGDRHTDTRHRFPDRRIRFPKDTSLLDNRAHA